MEGEMSEWAMQISQFCLSTPAFQVWMDTFSQGGVAVTRLGPQGFAYIVGELLWVAVPAFNKYCVVFRQPKQYGET